jgi:hypothetical protein
LEIESKKESRLAKLLGEVKVITPHVLESAVRICLDEQDYTQRHNCADGLSKNAPVAMLAIAQFTQDGILSEKIISKKNGFNELIDSPSVVDKLAMWYSLVPRGSLLLHVPSSPSAVGFPLYHSIQGQNLYIVRWETQFPEVRLECPSCGGNLLATRTNFSNNKRLFPIFHLNGPPDWAVVQIYKCSCCAGTTWANDGRLLKSLPPHVRDSYPVLPTYADPAGKSKCHLHRTASVLFEEMLLTTSSASAFSQMMYRAMNESYLRRQQAYLGELAYLQQQGKKVNAVPYVVKDGQYITTFPPTDKQLRDLYDVVSRSELTNYGVSAKMRHTREIQSVGCAQSYAQDHTFAPLKNYHQAKKKGMKAIWDVANEIGEIMCAVIVPSTKFEEYAHAAVHMLERPNFHGKSMITDTWPHGKEAWQVIHPGVEGSLGLFHFIKRICDEIKSNHVDSYEWYVLGSQHGNCCVCLDSFY